MMRKWSRHPAKTSRESSVAPASRQRFSPTPYEICGRGGTPIFLQVLIPGGFKSNDFASAESKGFAEAFFASAESKGFASAGPVRERHVVRVHRFGKALGGLCNSCSLAGISMSTGN